MEPITTIATKIIVLIFSEAFNEGGRILGKSTFEKIGKLVTSIRQKFEKSGTLGLLDRAQKQPTEAHISMVESELLTQMQSDNDFAENLAEILEKIEQADTARRIMFSGIKAKQLEVKGDLTQKAGNSGSVDMIMGSNLEIDGDVKFEGNLTQEG